MRWKESKKEKQQEIIKKQNKGEKDSELEK